MVISWRGGSAEVADPGEEDDDGHQRVVLRLVEGAWPTASELIAAVASWLVGEKRGGRAQIAGGIAAVEVRAEGIADEEFGGRGR